MKTETRNGLIFLAILVAGVYYIYKNSPVLQAEAKK
jgi:hypothetical protein